ncbi:predicted protein [Lichtheimia corymbifera JMRC:FSU:9682]|uniref:Uncharacterized protein n=1 Tax=Lichtheimia corymbifera JMRC:FSU:9682 TaxID=1263082 RepID=A0A068SC37_9FUNG|nr:predicted protein [Lichtheimia corymbifera JMRC:FSU:9682]
MPLSVHRFKPAWSRQWVHMSHLAANVTLSSLLLSMRNAIMMLGWQIFNASSIHGMWSRRICGYFGSQASVYEHLNTGVDCMTRCLHTGNVTMALALNHSI